MLSTPEGAATAALSPVFAAFSTAGGEGSATAAGGAGGNGRRSVRRVTQARITPTRRTAPAATVYVARRLPRSRSRSTHPNRSCAAISLSSRLPIDRSYSARTGPGSCERYLAYERMKPVENTRSGKSPKFPSSIPARYRWPIRRSAETWPIVFPIDSRRSFQEEPAGPDVIASPIRGASRSRPPVFSLRDRSKPREPCRTPSTHPPAARAGGRRAPVPSSPGRSREGPPRTG